MPDSDVTRVVAELARRRGSTAHLLGRRLGARPKGAPRELVLGAMAKAPARLDVHADRLGCGVVMRVGTGGGPVASRARHGRQVRRLRGKATVGRVDVDLHVVVVASPHVGTGDTAAQVILRLCGVGSLSPTAPILVHREYRFDIVGQLDLLGLGACASSTVKHATTALHSAVGISNGGLKSLHCLAAGGDQLALILHLRQDADHLRRRCTDLSKDTAANGVQQLQNSLHLRVIASQLGSDPREGIVVIVVQRTLRIS
mmetsp:Transcript_100680/g.150894  ORF Transcript_100680/g.150894 Transcript_100680/m.150894 type:complete len:258 (+) Transcript_100680:584-1357(+)